MEYLHRTDLMPPQPWEGYVHSVFRHSCNLMAPDGLLVTLHSFSGRVLPRSYYVPDLDTAELKTGMSVAASNHGLLFQGVTITGCDGCKVLSTKTKSAAGGPTSCRYAKALLEETRRRQSEELPLLAKLRRALTEAGRRLMPAVLDDQSEEIGAAVAECVGYGYGLTPSGDDFLLGILILLETKQVESPALREAVWNRRWQTNDISRTYLELALRGHAASFVRDAAASLWGGCGQSALPGLLEMGHTSGADVLEGMLIACDYLQQRPAAAV